ncbi:MAG: DNA-binding protein [Spirochaetaceae bacterium 4572_59]|nr:MAG: DNA-binding protein [Spirochaetaceae bacterium 4572_59]
MQTIGEWLESHITLHNNDTRKEERMNSLTHAIAAVLSLLGLVVLLIRTVPSGNPRFIIAALVFGLTMILMYSSSSIYHIIQPSNLKRALRIMDHVNIYLLIAGTYTPICLGMNNSSGHVLLLLVWTVAVLGIIFKLVFWGKVKPLHTIIYILMGWLVVFFFEDLKESIPADFLPWIFSGGIAYTLGTVFYAMKKMPYYHAVWHCFVIAGSACFYFGIYLHILVV